MRGTPLLSQASLRSQPASTTAPPFALPCYSTRDPDNLVGSYKRAARCPQMLRQPWCLGGQPSVRHRWWPDGPVRPAARQFGWHQHQQQCKWFCQSSPSAWGESWHGVCVHWSGQTCRRRTFRRRASCPCMQMWVVRWSLQLKLCLQMWLFWKEAKVKGEESQCSSGGGWVLPHPSLWYLGALTRHCTWLAPHKLMGRGAGNNGEHLKASKNWRDFYWNNFPRIFSQAGPEMGNLLWLVWGMWQCQAFLGIVVKYIHH